MLSVVLFLKLTGNLLIMKDIISTKIKLNWTIAWNFTVLNHSKRHFLFESFDFTNLGNEQIYQHQHNQNSKCTLMQLNWLSKRITVRRIMFLTALMYNFLERYQNQVGLSHYKMMVFTCCKLPKPFMILVLYTTRVT